MPEPRARRRTAVLISGRGSNLAALIAACAAPAASAEIALVISDRPAAGGLAHAAAAGIPTEVIDHRDHADRDGFSQALEAALAGHAIEIVCLAGFMRVLGAAMVERWRDRMLNVHPSLLPAFPGLDPHGRALAAGVRFHGCTVHFVRPAVDAGPIIVQGVLPVRQDDTAATLAARVLALEHRCFPYALELVAAGRTRVADERVLIDGASPPELMLINPQPTGARSG